MIRFVDELDLEAILHLEVVLLAMQRDLDIETLDMLVDESSDFGDLSAI